LKLYFYIADVVEWSRVLDISLSDWCYSVSMVWVQIPSREEQKFISSDIILTLFGLIFRRIYIYIYIIQKVWLWIIVGKMCGECYAPCILKTTFVYMYLKKILYSFYILLSLFSSWIYSWYTVPWKLSNNQSINPGHIWKREITFNKDLFPNTRHRNVINQMSIVF
jgi:hypothetical protein